VSGVTDGKKVLDKQTFLFTLHSNTLLAHVQGQDSER
jgi:hypothetical protein